MLGRQGGNRDRAPSLVRHRVGRVLVPGGTPRAVPDAARSGRARS